MGNSVSAHKFNPLEKRIWKWLIVKNEREIKTNAIPVYKRCWETWNVMERERERDVYILVPWYMWIDQSADLYQCKKYFWFDQSSSNKLLNTWSHGTWNWYHYMYKRLIYEVHSFDQNEENGSLIAKLAIYRGKPWIIGIK